MYTVYLSKFMQKYLMCFKLDTIINGTAALQVLKLKK